MEFNKQKEVSSFSCSKNKCKRKYFLLRRQWVLLLFSAILSSPSSLHLLPSAWASRDSSRRISTIELNIVTIFSSMHIVNWNIFCWAWWWRSTTNHKDLLRKKTSNLCYAGLLSLHNQCVGIHSLINFCPRNQKLLQKTKVLWLWNKQSCSLQSSAG